MEVRCILKYRVYNYPMVIASCWTAVLLAAATDGGAKLFWMRHGQAGD